MSEHDSNSSLVRNQVVQKKAGILSFFSKFRGRSTATSSHKILSANASSSFTQSQANLLCDRHNHGVRPKTEGDRLFPSHSYTNVMHECLSMPISFNVSTRKSSLTDDDKCLSRYLPKIETLVGKPLQHVLTEFLNLLAYTNDTHECLISAMTKYVTDNSLKENLIEVFHRYAKIRNDFKNQSQQLTSKLWNMQSAAIRAQEKALRKRIALLGDENRELHVKVDHLHRSKERLMGKVLTSSKSVTKRSSDYNSNTRLAQGNQKLYDKIDALTRNLDVLEGQLLHLQRQNDDLEQLCSASNSEKYALMFRFNQARMDNELEQATLKFQVQSNQKAIEESMKAGIALLDHFNGLENDAGIAGVFSKDRLQQLRRHDTTLMDVMSVLGTCLKECVSKATHTDADSVALRVELDSLRESNMKLQQNLQKSITELDAVGRKTSQITTLEETNKLLEQKCKQLQHQIDASIVVNSSSSEQMDHLFKQLTEKSESLKNVANENQLLCAQNESLKSIVTAYESGDFVNKLKTHQEQTTQLEEQIAKLTAEKMQLSEKADQWSREREELLEKQQTHCKQIALHQEEMEAASKERDLLAQQLSAEHETLIYLKNERLKYLEEKNILRAIFQQMKTEIGRLQKLEGTVADMSIETNRLAMIAEYNKELGEKLKGEVEIRDHAICELRTIFRRFQQHQQQSQHKLIDKCTSAAHAAAPNSAYNEINDAHDLSTSSGSEQKGHHHQHNKQRAEREADLDKKSRKTTIKELLKDFKALAKHRDELLHINEKRANEISKLEENLAILKTEHENITQSIQSKELHIKSLLKELNEKEKHMQDMSARLHLLETRHTKYQELVKETEELEKSNSYLKANIHKLHNDLNDSRAAEKEWKDRYNLLASEKDELEKRSADSMFAAEDRSKENEKLISSNAYLHNLCEKLASDLERMIEDNIQREKKYKSEIRNLENQLEETQAVIDKTSDKFNHKMKECNKLNTKIAELQDAITQMTEGYSRKVDQVRMENAEEMHELHLKYDEASKNLELASKEIARLLQASQQSVSENNTELHEMMKECADHRQNADKEIEKLVNDLVAVTRKFDDARKENNCLLEEMKLLKSDYEEVQRSLKEKECLCERLQMTKDYCQDVDKEKKNLHEHLIALSTELDERKRTLKIILKDKENLDNMLEECQYQHDQVVESYLALKKEYTECEQRLHESLHNIQQLETRLRQKDLDLSRVKDSLINSQEMMKVQQSNLMSLKNNVMTLQEQNTCLELQKCELTLKLHETETKLKTEMRLNVEHAPSARYFDSGMDSNLSDRSDIT